MNIISIGCSWTYGLGVEKNETYSAHLQNILPKSKVINGGHSGADIDHAIYTGIRLSNEWNPKICIFQLTTIDRITLGTDGNRFFRGRDYQNLDLKQDVYYEGDKDDLYTRTIGIGNETKTKVTIGSLLSSKKEKTKLVKESKITSSVKIFDSFLQLLFNDIIYSPYKIQKLYDSIFLFDQYLKSRNITPIYFSWLPVPHSIVTDAIQDNFIPVPVCEYLDSNYNNHSFYVDNGYHLSDEGNKIVAEEIILPAIEKLA